jgi:hypothetical protein
MDCGDAFMIEDEEGGKEHLHVLLTKPASEGEVVTACISTRRSRSETLVCLEVGDHPFIKHPSIVAYRFAAIRRCSDIEAAIVRGDARLQPKASDALVKRMQDGLVDSDFTPNEVRAFVRDRLTP